MYIHQIVKPFKFQISHARLVPPSIVLLATSLNEKGKRGVVTMHNLVIPAEYNYRCAPAQGNVTLTNTKLRLQAPAKNSHCISTSRVEGAQRLIVGPWCEVQFSISTALSPGHCHGSYYC